MKKVLTFLHIFSFSWVMVNAQNIITVDNSSGSIADYTSLQIAIDAAGEEDFIYVYGSPNNYGDIIVEKKVNIIGPGYFLASNNGGIDNPAPAILSNLDLLTGSDDSYISGLNLHLVGGSTSQDRALIENTSNVIFEKNLVRGNVQIKNSSNITFHNNFTLKYLTLSSFGGRLEIVDGSSNIIVSNNCFTNDNTSSSNTNIEMDIISSAEILNNVFTRKIECFNSVIKNNIFLLDQNIDINDNSILFNLFTVPINDVIPGNTTTTDISSICLGYPDQGSFSPDGRFDLKSNSPASGIGEGGINCGIFDGPSPYILSGLPSIPIIYSLDAPVSAPAGGTIQITVKARTN